MFTCNTFHKLSYNYKLYIAFHVKRVGKIGSKLFYRFFEFVQIYSYVQKFKAFRRGNHYIEYYECIDYERKVDVLCLYFQMEVKEFAEVRGILVVWCQKITFQVK